MADDAIDWKLWAYTPSLAGGVVAAAAFACLTFFHLYRLIGSRTWFCIPFVVGGFFETIGYAARAAAPSDLEALAPYIIDSILILLAPILFAGSVYMILGRIMRATNGTHHSLIRVTWVTKIFVSGDILCFLVQGAGGGLLATAKTQTELDRFENIILGGLILQIVMFGFFVVVGVIFHRRLRQMPTTESLESGWERYMAILYTVSGLITVRNVMRAIEYAWGQKGYLLRHEWCLYVYDFLPMVAVLSICLVWYTDSLRPSQMELPMATLQHRSLLSKDSR